MLKKPSMKKLLLVDGNSLLHRAYHAYPDLSTSEGEKVGAVYGFTNLMLSAIEKLSPNHVIVAWDVSKITFRHEVYKEYKAGRPEMDEDLADQIERTKEVVGILNIPQFGINGFEADDIIGTISKLATTGPDTQVTIMTGDRDALQLVSGAKVIVYMPSLGTSRFNNGKDRGVSIYDEEAVKAKYGLTPKQIIDLKGLMGDASDNIAGVPGIGQVTATKLLQQAGSVEEVYEKIETLDITQRVKQLLLDGREAAAMSKELVTINREVPLDFSWDACHLADYDKEKALKLFERLEFRSLVAKLPKDKWENDLEDVFS